MMGTAIQQPDPQLTFQPLHLLAQRRLHDMLPLRRPAEMRLLSQRHEIAELTQLHTPAAKSASGPSLHSLELGNPARKPTCAPGLLECVTGLGRR